MSNRRLKYRFWLQLCDAVPLLIFLALGPVGCRTLPQNHLSFSTSETVGQVGTNRYFTPANQILTPSGLQVELPGMRPQAIALSPNGRLLITAGKTHELIVIEPVSGRILQRVPLPASADSDPAPDSVSEQILDPDTEGQLSFTGLAFSPDGSRIYLSNVQGDVKVFGVNAELNGAPGRTVGLFTIRLPEADAPRRKSDIPAGIAVSADGKRLYVALNLSNRLAELNAADGKLLRLWDVGVAPFAVVLVGYKAYVSNWGGRRPGANDLT